MNIKRIGQILFIIMVGLMLCCNMIASVIKIEKLNNKNFYLNDNRVLAEKPEFKPEEYQSFFKNYESYYNDQFPLRGLLVSTYGDLKYQLFSDAYSTNLSIGLDKWIFYKDTIKEYKRAESISEQDMEHIKIYLEYIQKLAQAQNAQFYVLVAPNKNEIYSEKMSKRIKTFSQPSSLDQIQSMLKEQTDIAFIDAKQAILNQKHTGELYYSNGTHWNTYGAWYAFEQMQVFLLQDHASIAPLSFANFETKTVPYYTQQKRDYTKQKVWGDMSIYREDEIKLKEANFNMENVKTEDPNPSFYITSKRIDGEDNLKALIFRDSFFTALQPMLSQSIPNCAYYWTPNVTPEIISQENPDIIIYEIVQRNYAQIIALGKVILQQSL